LRPKLDRPFRKYKKGLAPLLEYYNGYNFTINLL